MLYLNFFSHGRYANRRAGAFFKFFRRQRYTVAFAFDFETFADRSYICVSDTMSTPESFQDIHVDAAVFGSEQGIEFREYDIDAFLQTIEIYIQFFL